MPSCEEEWIRKVNSSFDNITEEEEDAVWDRLVEKGIIDRHGKVLVRMPEGPPDWARPANGQPPKPESPPKRTRKRSKS